MKETILSRDPAELENLSLDDLLKMEDYEEKPVEDGAGPFYVYEHWRPDRDVCFYVGKGKGKRANSMYGRGKYHQYIQGKLSDLGMCVEVRLVSENLDEETAFSIEIERIAFWRARGVRLSNATDGGEGVSGYVQSLERRALMSLVHKGKPKSEEQRRKISESNKGRVAPEETRRRQSEAHKGQIVSPEQREKIGKSTLGKKRSAETRARMAESARIAHKLYPRSDEVKKRIGDSQRGPNGKKHTEETKAKMSASAKAWREERRRLRASMSFIELEDLLGD